LNQRLPAPKAGALAKLSYTPKIEIMPVSQDILHETAYRFNKIVSLALVKAGSKVSFQAFTYSIFAKK
jgi:hypothetical protein